MARNSISQNAAAVGDGAIPGGTDPVGVGGKKAAPLVQEDAGILQLAEGDSVSKPAQRQSISSDKRSVTGRPASAS